jgi:hypothetical protein
MTDPRAERQDAPLTDAEQVVLDKFRHLGSALRCYNQLDDARNAEVDREWKDFQENHLRLIRELREARAALDAVKVCADNFERSYIAERDNAVRLLCERESYKQEIEQLSGQAEAARIALDALGKDRDRVLGELVAVRAQADANAKDRERLEWLQKNWEALESHYETSEDQLRVWVPIFIRDSDSYLQLREAIDAAIAQEENR